MWVTNFKSKNLGRRKNDELCFTISSRNDPHLDLLKECHSFFQNGTVSILPALRNENFIACKLMCETLSMFAEYLIENGFAYVLLGYCQSDAIEQRFGLYRKMSGSNYFISVKQVSERERKLKIYSSLKHPGIYR